MFIIVLCWHCGRMTLPMVVKKHPISPYSTQLCDLANCLINQAFAAILGGAGSVSKSCGPCAHGGSPPFGTNRISNLRKSNFLKVLENDMTLSVTMPIVSIAAKVILDGRARMRLC